MSSPAMPETPVPAAAAVPAPASALAPIAAGPAPARVPARVRPRVRDHLVATLLDLTIVAAVGVVAALSVALPLIPLGDTVSSAVYYVALLPMGAAAYVGLLGRRGRTRTLGQWVCSLRVVGASGGWVTTRRRMLREGLKWLVPLGVAWLAHQGWRLAHGESWGRPFHDVLARTDLVREPR
jgi:uncharacterized RDD family membrane protein YckC